MKEIEEVANRCLNCKLKPCSKKGCPMQTNIPEFIEKIKEGNYKEAYDILIENNYLSYICSIICPQEEQCEGSCVRGIKENPISIGRLEKMVNEWAIENNYEHFFLKKEKNGKKVAIVGSGPSGLECAVELLKNGYEVDIFEKDDVPGGILEYGIPDFRLPKKIVEKLITSIEKLGANFKVNQEMGKDFSVSDLQKKYDAVFIGIGAGKSTVYSLASENTKNIYTSDVFLKKYNEQKNIKDLGVVVVIGGGNVAMDCARTAKKMGAEDVKILYRRDSVHMPAREIELEDALKDGVKFKELVRVENANTKDGKIISLNCVRTEIVNGKAVDSKDGQTFIEDANTVIFAIGLKPDKSLLESQGIILNEWGYVKIDENGMTNLDKVFAGGDITEEKFTVCRALAAGKRAANGIMSIM